MRNGRTEIVPGRVHVIGKSDRTHDRHILVDANVVHELPSATFAITSNQKLIIGAGYSYYNSILIWVWRSSLTPNQKDRRSNSISAVFDRRLNFYLTLF